jgi:hypothetical protein
VLDQDRDMLESLYEDARDNELLLQTDIGISRMRRILRQIAEHQVKATEKV